MKDNEQAAGGAPPEPNHAQHGYRNEVTWEGGSGRQPYANQGRRETPGPGAAIEVEEGNRREQSGENLAQSEAVKGKP